MGSDGHFAWQQSTGSKLRFGSKADIGACPRDVRYCPESGHWNSAAKCPLSRREKQEEEDADVTDIIGGDIENKEEG